MTRLRFNTILGSYLIVCLNLISFTTCYGKDPLSRLFTTADQRQRLDALRSHQGAPESPQNGLNGAKDSNLPSTQQAVRLDGYVKRDNGKDTVWISGRKLELDPNKQHQVKFKQTESNQTFIQLQLDPLPNLIQLKPGQTYLPAQQEVRENFTLPNQLDPASPVADTKGKR